MTLDQLIKAAQAARAKHGGEIEVYVEWPGEGERTNLKVEVIELFDKKMGFWIEAKEFGEP